MTNSAFSPGAVVLEELEIGCRSFEYRVDVEYPLDEADIAVFEGSRAIELGNTCGTWCASLPVHIIGELMDAEAAEAIDIRLRMSEVIFGCLTEPVSPGYLAFPVYFEGW
jgi:hypothetical protein